MAGKRKKICLVAPRLNTTGAENDCGSFFLNLAQLLAELENWETTILFSGLATQEALNLNRSFFAGKNVDLVSVQHDLLPLRPHGRSNEWFIEYSIDIADYLERSGFDTAVFSTSQGNGFSTIQRKKTGISLCNLHTILAYEPSAGEIRNEYGLWPSIPHVNMRQSYMEEYCLKYSDQIVTNHLSELEKSIRIENPGKIVLLSDPGQNKSSVKNKTENVDFRKLTIVGGTDANLLLPWLVEQLMAAYRENGGLPFAAINFLNFTGETPSVSLSRKGIPCERMVAELSDQLDGVNITSAREDIDLYLRENRPHLVWAESFSSLYNHTLYAALERGYACFAMDRPGSRAIVKNSSLLQSRNIPAALQAPERYCIKRDSLIDQSDSRAGWISLLEGPRRSKAWEISSTPMISICIAHYNYGQYLPALLRSLSQQTYQNLEVVVTDDGSTDQESIDEFRSLSESYSGKNWHFYTKENEGIGKTRNFSVKQSSGNYLIFMDADNLALPEMAEVFALGMQRSDSDCLSCHYDAFEEELPDIAGIQPLWRFAPLGGPLELGLIKNVFGDANFCIKRQVFEALSGFGVDRSTSYEDWEFLARLVLKGYSLDVINRVLFKLRVQQQSYSRNTNQRRNMQRVFNTYYQQGFELNEHIVEELLYPYFLNNLKHTAKE